MTDDVEPLLRQWRLEICRDGVELRFRRPRSARREMLGSLLELTLAHGVRRVDKVQLMLRVGTLEQLAEPRTLRSRIAGKIEDDGDALRQERTHVWSQRVL